MKQKDERDTALYRSLKSKFGMQPDQAARLEQRLRERLTAVPRNMPDTPQKLSAHSRPERLKQRFGRCWDTMRFVPLAACVMLALVGGWMIFNTENRPDPEQMQISSEDLAEQTVLTAAETEAVTEMQTVFAAESVTSAAAVTMTIQKTTQPQQASAETAAAATETQPPQEAVLPETDAEPERPAVTEMPKQPAEQPIAETVPVSTEAPLECTEQPEIPAETVRTAEQPPLSESGAYIIMENVSAAAGETVKLIFRLTHELECTGMQFTVRAEAENVPLPVFSAAESSLLLMPQFSPTDLVCNMDEANVYMLFAKAEAVVLPAGTVLLEAEAVIPADAPAGTVYRIVIGEKQLFIVESDGLTRTALTYDFGTITVI
ncbi:MAG: hypothetical protein IKQ91_10505 [Oscillospiraceae bacterium]|nr:hypothetical protein [Oscillospiraceae bacterium]